MSNEQRRAGFAAALAAVLSVAAAVMDNDMAWVAFFVTWAIFAATALIIGAIDRRER